MSTQKNKPVDTIRDRELKATIWKNFGKSGTFFTVEISRTYKDDQGKYHPSHSFNQDQLLRVSRLADIAYSEVAHHYGEIATQEAA